MYGLTAALFAASAMAAPASTPDQNACSAKSTKVTEFQVKNFDFHASYLFTTPAHQNSWGYVNFTLANAALDYEYQCQTESNWLNDFFYGLRNYECTDAAGKRTQEGTFSYSRPAQTLAINQTWACPEGSRFWAEGKAKLNIECDETKYENPDWHRGEIYSDRRITCAPFDQAIPITSLRAAA